MNSIKQMLSDNIHGEDRINLCAKLKCSQSKLNLYLSGEGTVKEEEDKIVSYCLEYFAEKYRSLLRDIEAAKAITNQQNGISEKPI